MTALFAPVLVGILEGFEKGARVRISVGLRTRTCGWWEVEWNHERSKRDGGAFPFHGGCGLSKWQPQASNFVFFFSFLFLLLLPGLGLFFFSSASLELPLDRVYRYTVSSEPT